MRTNVEIDDDLMASAMRVTGVTTKREMIDRALRMTLRLKRQEELMQLWGLGWDGDLDDMRTSKYVAASE